MSFWFSQAFVGRRDFHRSRLSSGRVSEAAACRLGAIFWLEAKAQSVGPVSGPKETFVATNRTPRIDVKR
jgi:hypothetical protein